MKVSIITATYNSESTIESTLQSVASQTYKDIEHIIIDGASKDDTISIVNRYEHVSQVISEADQGIYDAMNKGLNASSGDIIAILNSDDLFVDKDVVSRIVDAFNETKTDIIYGKTIAGFIDEKGEMERITRRVNPGPFNPKKFLYGWMPSHVSTYVKSEMYQKYGNFKLNYKIGADYELMLRMMYKFKVKTSFVDMYCVKFRIGGISTSNLSNKILALKEAKIAWKENNIKPYLVTFILKPSRAIFDIFFAKFSSNTRQ